MGRGLTIAQIFAAERRQKAQRLARERQARTIRLAAERQARAAEARRREAAAIRALDRQGWPKL